MYLNMLGRLLVFILCLRRTVCLASSSSSSTPHGEHGSKTSYQPKAPIRVASLNKNGGNVKYFDLVPEEDPKSKDDKSIRSRLNRHPRVVATALSRQLIPALRTTFLPTGFPDKTPPGYLRFSAWSWIQDTSTQLRSVLATQKVLEGVGVGKEGATALSALFNYLVRDGCGMIANLLFTYGASSRFRTDVKRWRIFADMSVDIGITLEVAATLFPKSFFLPCICLGNMFKALCGVAAGATGGSINLHWAKGSDISDINAKFGAQHTVTGAIGLVSAGLFAKSVNHVSPQSLWLMYFVLTYLHLYANVKCMRLISFDYLNTIRLDMILRNYYHTISKEDSSGLSICGIPTPQRIAQQEPLWFQIPVLGRILPRREKTPLVYFGVAYDEFCKRSSKPIELLRSEMTPTTTHSQSRQSKKTSKSRIEHDAQTNNDNNNTVSDGYIISIGNQGFSSSDETGISTKPCVVVSLLMDVSPQQQVKAYFHAWLLTMKLQERLGKQSNVSVSTDLASQLEVEAEVILLLESKWGAFAASCTDAGWDLSRSELQTHGYEVKVV
mmetsp:Transcript_11752/g.24837  ORF Transcript_11752/g.24837 Transcript_11752/m.24837 type:complete len:554 (-) Transcript_11752:1667-3328(-)